MHDRPLQCPRCGYDQAGVIATWEETCPLHGTCAECGLALAWREVFSAQWRGPALWVECTRSALAIPFTAVLAPLVACAPWWLCRRLSMRDPLRPWRWLLVLVLWPPLLHGALVAAVLHYAHSRGWTILSREGVELAMGVVWPFDGSYTNSPWYSGSSLMSYRREEWLRRTALEQLLAGIALLATAVSVAAFAVLPIARARAKVQWRHLARAGVIVAFSIPLAACIIGFAARRSTSSWDINSGTMSVLFLRLGPAVVTAVVCAMWLAVWWHALARWYLRMDRPWAVAFSVASIATLTVALVVCLRVVMQT